jgi:hypothetical protein
MGNIEEARNSVRGYLNSKTTPDAHRHTAYGLMQAGIEYLDHGRRAHSDQTRFTRSMLRPEPAKAKLAKLIKDCVAA